jgi:hypothetical protein
VSDRTVSRDAIVWPPRYDPGTAPVHVRNEILLAAPCDAAWAWLIRAALWPVWYPNASRVTFLSGPAPDLAAATRFRWKTFGVTIDSTVTEYVPGQRIAWTAKGFGVDAYHAWLFTPGPDGCRVLTEETQHGWLARLANFLMPRRMYRGHQLWLETLHAQALRGHPPAM